MADITQEMDASTFDGNDQSSSKWGLKGLHDQGLGRINHSTTKIAPDGSNPYGLPRDSMVRLQQRVLKHVASRKNELHSTIMTTIQSTVGSTLSLGDDQHKNLLANLGRQFGLDDSDYTGSDYNTYTAQPGFSGSGSESGSGSAGGSGGGFATRKVPTKEEQKEGAKDGTRELVALFQHEASVIVDMAVETIMSLVNEGKVNKQGCVSRPGTTTQTHPAALSPMLSRSLSSRSNPLTNPFSQQTAPLADPATTVCLPHATFVAGNNKGLPDSSKRLPPAATHSPVVTTFVSENSITEVTWLNYPPESTATPAGRKPGLFVPTTRSSNSSRPQYSLRQWASSSASRQTSLDQSVKDAFDYFSFPSNGPRQDRRFSVPAPVPATPHGPGRYRHASQAPVDYHMTSFPPLPSRMQTNDWLVAPVRPTQKQENCSTWYAQGIDARCASHSSVDTPQLETPRTRIYSTAPRTLKHCSASSFDQNAAPKMGSAVGISSGRRRSPPSGTSSSFMSRIRRGSAQLGQAITSAVGIASPHPEQHAQRDSSVTSLKRLLATVPQEIPSPVRDTHQACAEHEADASAAAHVQAHHHSKRKRPGLTHQHSSVIVPHGDSEISWRKDHAGQCAPCSEDSRPHVCLMASGETSRTVTPGVGALGAFV